MGRSPGYTRSQNRNKFPADLLSAPQKITPTSRTWQRRCRSIVQLRIVTLPAQADNNRTQPTRPGTGWLSHWAISRYDDLSANEATGACRLVLGRLTADVCLLRFAGQASVRGGTYDSGKQFDVSFRKRCALRRGITPYKNIHIAAALREASACSGKR